MTNIADKSIVLKLNRNWVRVGVGTVGDTICDLMTGVVTAVDITYPFNDDGSPNFTTYDYIKPVRWDEWIQLPVRPWDLCINSTKIKIRVPTVVITTKYAKIPEKKFKGKPTKEGLFIRDNGIDPYTTLELDFDSATIDHVIPTSRGGTDTYDNTVLTTKEINNRKGNKLNSEAGLVMQFLPTQPKPMLVSQTIRRARHHDWKHFLGPVK